MSQYQCGGPSSQNPYASSPRWAVTPPTSIMRRMPIPVRPKPFLQGGCPPRIYAGLARLSPGCPPDRGRLHTCYSPVRRSPARGASTPSAAPRLACVKPAASVHPEPGSNSPLLLYLFRSFALCLSWRSESFSGLTVSLLSYLVAARRLQIYTYPKQRVLWHHFIVLCAAGSCELSTSQGLRQRLQNYYDFSRRPNIPNSKSQT